MEQEQKNPHIRQVRLAIVDQAIQDMNKTLSALLNSPSFQHYLRNIDEIQKAAERVRRIIEPTLIQKQGMLEHLNEIMSSVKFSDIQPLLKEETIFLPPPKPEKNIDEIIQATIEKTLESIRNKELPTRKYKFPHLLPKNAAWNTITIKFKDGHNVQIVVDEYIYSANYTEMGFEDSRQLKPNLQWKLLKALSENNGGVSWDEPHANTQIKKQKQLLASKLKQYFGIDEDPFYPYKREKGYIIKINLIPEKGSINDRRTPENDDLGIDQFYKESTSGQ